MPKRLVSFALLTLCLMLWPISASAQSGDAADSGLVLVESGYDVDETVTRLVATLEEKGLTVMGTVDHAANAASVDKELLPTQVILFGNPNLGTPLMQNSRSVAIDLPQKYLVWEDTSGRTFVTYNSVPYLTDRHGLTGPEEVLTRVTGALANFAGSVAPAAEEPAAEEPAAEEPAPEPTEIPAEEPAPEPTEIPAEEPADEEPVVEESAPVQAEPAPVEEPELLPVTGSDGSSSTFLWVLLTTLLVGLLFFVLPGLRKNLAKNKIVGLLLFGMLATLSVGLPASVEADNHNGLIANDSPYSVEDTVERLQAAMEARDLRIMMVIDHSANAANVDLELPPTQVIIFGNPNVGTGLMQASRTVAIDLPQKMLVWDDGEGNVQVIYNDPAYLTERHTIAGLDQVVTNVTGAFEAIVTEATAEE